jgi:hypothetical protein
MLIQVVPRRTAEPNGVADYALALARVLRERSGIGSVFLSATSSAETPPKQDEWRTISVPRRRALDLAAVLRSLSVETGACAVLLHFVGYGYQNRGLPLWLVNGLKGWRRRTPDVPLLTIFHELYAIGRPWQSAFWLSPVQQQIARSILKLSSAAVTPTHLGCRCLSGWLNGDDRKTVTAMPVFSNVGEPRRELHPSTRAATAVVFGLTGVEDRLFGIYRSDLERIVATLGIESIFDVGPRSSSLPRTLAGVPVISKGALPQPVISKLLQQTRFGFIAYPIDVIGKSGVFAAYAAHGVIPVVFSDADRLISLDGLRPNQHFLDGFRLSSGTEGWDLASIQGELFDWYASHALPVQVDFLTSLMGVGPLQAGTSQRPVSGFSRGALPIDNDVAARKMSRPTHHTSSDRLG